MLETKATFTHPGLAVIEARHIADSEAEGVALAKLANELRPLSCEVVFENGALVVTLVLKSQEHADQEIAIAAAVERQRLEDEAEKARQLELAKEVEAKAAQINEAVRLGVAPPGVDELNAEELEKLAEAQQAEATAKAEAAAAEAKAAGNGRKKRTN